jgi:hypothetical protein
MSTTSRLLAVVVMLLGVVMGFKTWNAHLIARGDAQGAQRVQTLWDTAEARRNADEKEAALRAMAQQAQAQAQVRAQEQAKQQEAERIAREQAQREQQLQGALAAATASNRSLHTAISQLNANAAAAMSSTAAPTSCSTELDAATTARNALGACSSRYTDVAGVADQLAIQVTGLQDHLLSVTGSNQGAANGD